MTATHTDNRLTDRDRFAMGERVREVTAGYGREWQAKWSDVPTLERVALGAIGCGPFDMREDEIEEVRAMVADITGLAERLQTAQVMVNHGMTEAEARAYVRANRSTLGR